MPDDHGEPPRWQRLLLGTIGLLVPRRARSRWRREWLAEIAYRRRRSRPAPVGGALVDAMHLRRQNWSLDVIHHDLRQALRALTSRPGFTAVAIATLALGIGANSVIFSVVDAVVLEPQPYPGSDRLVMLYTDNRIQGWPRDVSSWPNFADWRERSGSFESMAAYSYDTLNLTGDGEPRRLRAAVVSPSLFRVLGVEALHGRTLVDADQDEDGAVVVLSHALWQQRFGADASAVGRDLTLDGQARRVVGVMPAGFRFPSDTVDLWMPFGSDVADTSRGNLWLRVVGRLAPGVDREAARQEMSAVAAGLEEENPDVNEGLGVNVVGLHEDLVGDMRQALLVLLGAVGLVLLVACANVANLMLARAADRRREIAVRAALGASRGRIVRQLLCESTLLAVVAGAAGLGLSVVALDAIIAFVPTDIPRLDQASLDPTVTIFTVVVSVATGLAFGLFPALHAAGVDLHSRLNDGARGGTDRRGQRARQGLVVAEVALAVVLLAGAGLLVRSFQALQRVDPGLRTVDVLTVRLALPESRYAEPGEGRTFFVQLVDRLETVPGVSSAAAVQVLPLTESAVSANISIEGRPELTGAQRREVRSNVVTPGYFRTVGIPLLRGELPWDRDDPDRPFVAAVNQAFADLFFPGDDPVGERFTWGVPDPGEEVAWIDIVGVVGNVRQRGPEETVAPEAYLSIDQVPRTAMNLLVRTEGDPLARVGAVREQVWSLDRDLPVDDVLTLDELLERAYSRRRFSSRLLALFAASAALLASLGLYGLMAHSVAARRREIGVRMAMGARRRDVTGMVLRQALALTALGLALGLAGALGLSRLLSTMLYGVSTRDPVTLGAVVLLLAGVAAMASWLPARRAAATDPVTALSRE